MSYAKKVIAAGAAGVVLAATGGVGALAAPAGGVAGSIATPIGSVFSGTVEATAGGGILVQRKQRKGDGSLVAVDIDGETVVSKGGQELSLANVPAGTEVIISGTRAADGSVLASKILVRS